MATPKAATRRSAQRAVAAPAPEGVRQPLGKRYEGKTVNVQYTGGGELTLRSRAVPGASYNFSRGSVVAVAAEDAPRFTANKDFRVMGTAAPKPEPEAPKESGVPTFPDKEEDK